MRALRTAQPRRACDTTVFSCANRGDGVPGQWPPIIAWPVRRVRRGLTVPLRTADVVPTERSSFVVTARFCAILGKFHCPSLGAKVSGPHSAHGSAPVPTFSRAAPPVRRVPSPGRPVCTRRARPPESLGRSPVGCRAVHGGPRRFVPLRSGACAHVAVATSTHLAVETITNVYTRSQYVIYWLSQLELPPLEITWARL